MKNICLKLSSILFVLLLTITGAFSQVPDGFSYQAIARDNSGNPLSETNLDVRIAILSSISPLIVIWEEEHAVSTNNFGLFTLTVGTSAFKTNGSLNSFSEIDWSIGEYYIRPSVKESSGSWQILDASRIQSVPFSIATKSHSGGKLEVVSLNDASVEALFEVRRKDGQPVFSVFPDRVEMHVDDVGTKGARGGFSVGGFDRTKGSQDYLFISPDSIRMYIPETDIISKKGAGSRGGFAVGGFDPANKAEETMYFNLSGNKNMEIYEDVARMLWYPQKEAFQAGRINIINTDSVGQNSIAFGYHPQANGNYSQAFGRLAIAAGENSTAIGHSAIARGLDSYALGSGAQAIGINSFALGSGGIDTSGVATGLNTMASGTNSFALGMGAQATNTGSIAFGLNARSTGHSATSIGYYSESSGNYSMALGYKSRAIGMLGASFGVYSRAEGRYSLSLGYSSDALDDYSVSVGFNAQSSGKYSTGIGYNSNASENYSTAIGYKAVASGLDSYSFGSQSEALGEKSFAFGTVGLNEDGTPNKIPTKASGNYSLAMGMGTSATSLGSIAIGVNTSSLSDGAVALGNGARAQGEYATALGYKALANGNKAISIGAYYDTQIMRFIYNPVTRRFEITYVPIQVDNEAIGDYSIALGNGNYASNGGFAIGSNNDAKGYGAVAIGHTNYADSAYSFAAGSNNYSRALNAFAMGQNLYAVSANSFVVGRYNNLIGTRDEWVENDPLFVIGNGTGSSTRKDAFIVYKNGDAYIDGDLTVTGNLSAAVAGDGLGTHSATQNIRLNSYWLSGDGGSEGIRVSSTGLVGINDATPSYTLDVNGTGRFTGTLYANSNFYASGRIESTSTADATGIANTGGLEIGGTLRLDGDELITNTGITLMLQNDNGGDLSVDGSTMFVDASANRVGIGTTAPSYTLDVSGSIRSTSTITGTGTITGGSLNTSLWKIDNVLNKPLGVTALVTSYNGTGVFAIETDGVIRSVKSYSEAVGATNRVLYVDDQGQIGIKPSSIRYKTDIKAIDNIEWVYNLRPVNYYFKNDDSKMLQYGLIAEEVEKVNNDFVSYNNDGVVETVNYSELISPLIKAVQSQKISFDSQSIKLSSLEEENINLKTENDDLRQRIEQLEAAVNSILNKEK